MNREYLNIYLFSTGKAISLFGSAIYSFAVSLYVLKTTGSGLSFATNIMLYTLPIVFITPLAGVIADRVNKKLLIVSTDVFNGIFLISIYLLVVKQDLSLPLIYFSTFIITTFATFFNIGIESAKPQLVKEDKLININSVAKVIESASNIVGPVLGGMIFAFSNIKTFILINGISFLIAAIVEYFIDYDFNKREEDREVQPVQSIYLDMKEGYSYIFSRISMRSLIYIFVGLNFLISFSVTVPVPYLLNTYWLVDPKLYGIIQSGFPVGMLIGAVLIKKIMGIIDYDKLLFKINLVSGTAFILLGMPLLLSNKQPTDLFLLIYYTLLMIIIGVVIAWVDVPLMVILQQTIPGKILGRVLSVLISIVKIVVPVTLLLSGLLVNIISPLYLFVSGGILMISFNIIFFRSASGKALAQLQKY